MSEKTKSHGRLAIRPSLKPRALMTDTPELQNAWTVKVITLFPEAFPGVLDRSLTGKALQEGLWQLQTIELRGFGLGKHKDVDHPPAGGGAGMVLKADVVGPALEDARRGTPMDPKQWPVIYMSPRGKQLTQSMVQSWSEAKGMTILCGRFEGVDERVLEEFNVEEISLGDFVLTGGEVAAQALIDATVRLIPNVLGNQESTKDESHSNGLLEHPQYTKPAEWNGREIPKVLLSGHHENVKEWRAEMSERITKERRPDLWEKYSKLNKHKIDETLTKRRKF
ncbi:tRNA (guanosine(37)-N1)-methyltransferase TrmD [Amylibacter sp.]|nr:tRNA (guanosine(37)-N1)-methyltransferase TrmD [Amylibacter sp.]MDA9074274.1 tRNA (guanosine(37)-N1)-methyltransferase TrmD [Amylibacter sp.]MDA9178244.1 tRNA (guanosine(37)-N1)-methyltransferase TrmD [Amylibacter sp.]MDA9290459.1 tRNA (guanosine(37)-N1)-methyltransferase TrmD [Amylibacter sp.]MDA9927092.1 tRNA (guanosine(37)-N1)-methyltransferase TrmD [Amylibacter sp.]